MADSRPSPRRQALDLLARREHSRLELERKLAARDYEPELIGETLDQLQRENLQSDERFAESFVQARAARGQGPVRIRMELAERGVSGADACLREAGLDWAALARETRIKRFGKAVPGDFKEKARQMRFLQYRGFSHDQITAALEFGNDSD
jgi:regulatory protein